MRSVTGWRWRATDALIITAITRAGETANAAGTHETVM